jgi:hypothetical protein
VTAEIVDRGDELAIAVLDFARVSAVGAAASRILFDLMTSMDARGQLMILSSCERHGRLLRYLDEERVAGGASWRLIALPDLDRAIEWCENELIVACEGASCRIGRRAGR